MSVLRVAVETHCRRNGIELRALLAAAYYHKYGKPLADAVLDDDVRRWNAGEANISYLYDFVLKTCAA